ncbi:MAG: hypothetical protein AAGG68_23865 [Bacteroidota bacterium]
MMNQLTLTAICLLFTYCMGTAQLRSCQEEYNQVYKLDDQSTAIFDTDKGIIERKIEQSQQLVQKGLGIAYEAIQKEDCEAYSILVDRIINLEMRIGNPDNAEKVALDRLDRLYPNWRNWKEKVDIPSNHISVLARMGSYREEDNFYMQMLKQRRIYGVCGTVSYGEEVSYLLRNVKSLYTHYGKRICLRYLENYDLILHEEHEYIAPIYNEIYKLLIKSLKKQYTHAELINMYKSAVIQREPDGEEYFIGYPYTGRYYIEFHHMKFYIKSNYKYVDRKKVITDPIDLEAIKNNSSFYLKLKSMTK